MNYLMKRLGEHSTQVAIGGAVATVSAAIQGQLQWSTAISLLLGTAVTALMPSSDPPEQTTVVVPPPQATISVPVPPSAKP